MNAKLLGVTIAFVAVMTTQGALVNAWFNEFHYDNDGDDVGEFLEVAVPSDFTDLGNLTVTLYNGVNGMTYGSAHDLSTFLVGSAYSGHQLYSLSLPLNGLQNGAPDGFSLSHAGILIQFLSYEGSFTAAEGPAVGQGSINIGVSESGSTAEGASLGLEGTGNHYSDFSWTDFNSETLGTFNLGQTFTAVPEPEEWGLIAALGLFAVAGLHSWRSRRQSPSAIQE